MNTKLKIDKTIRDIPEKTVRNREVEIKRIQAEYGYDRSNAAKIYEYEQLKGR